MSELSDAVAAVTELVAKYGQTRDEMVDLLSGPADGGPQGDGRYPVTTENGAVIVVPSLPSIDESSIKASYLSMITGRTLSSYGAVADAKHLFGVTIEASSDILNHAAGGFVEADVGKSIAVAGGGGPDTLLITTIVAFNSAAQVQLAVAASADAVAIPSQSATIGTNCGPALQAAIDDIEQAEGGPILIDGDYALFSGVFRNFGAVGEKLNPGGVELVGVNRGTLRIACAADVVAMGFVNGTATIRRLALVGTMGATTDALHVLRMDAGAISLIESTFVALMNRETGAPIGAGNTRIAIRDSFFAGCSGQVFHRTAVVDVVDCLDFEVRNSEFRDYGTHDGFVFSKTPIGSPYAWIHIRSMAPNSRGVLRFTDNRFDEGGYHAIRIGSEAVVPIDRVMIDGAEINGWGDTPGAIFVANSRVVEITRSSMNYQNGAPTVAIYLANCEDVKVDAIQVGVDSTVTRFMAFDCGSVAITNSPGFTDYTTSNVSDFSIDRKPGMLAVIKDGVVTDSDFITPPVPGTLAGGDGGRTLYIKGENGLWGSVALTQIWAPAALFYPDTRGLWYDLNDMATMWQDEAGTIPAAVNSPVGRIRDKSRNGYHATQGAPDARPILRNDGARNYLEFDGTKWMTAGDVCDLRQSGVFGSVAGRVSSTGVFYAKSLAAAAGGRFAFYLLEGNLGSQYVPLGGGDWTASTPYSNTDNHVFTQRLNRTIASNRVVVDGTAIATLPFPNDTAADIDSTYRLLIGAYNNSQDDGVVAMLNGRIYDLIIVMDDVTDEQASSVYSYQAAKAGVILP